LYLTPKHLVFNSSTSKTEIWIYYSWINSVDKQPINTAGSPIQIKCKTFLNISFIIQKERDCQSLYATLVEKSKPGRKLDGLLFYFYFLRINSKL
jgi:myotubularin-related protein 6/7/8